MVIRLWDKLKDILVSDGFHGLCAFFETGLATAFRGHNFMREYTLRFRAGLVSVAEGLGLLNPAILRWLASAKAWPGNHVLKTWGI